MYICKGEVVGFNCYKKDGAVVYYAQVVYDTKLASYTGKRVATCRVDEAPVLGSKVDVADDFRSPSIIQKDGK